MIFTSLSFCVFFIVVTTLYYALPWHARWKMLLVASCYFYMFFYPPYILILLVTIIIDYTMGILIAGAEGHRRKVFLIISILSTCAVLFCFKYYNFFVQSVERAAAVFGFNPDFPLSLLLLPLGLSFHTFQGLSYVIEVYRGNQKPEHNLGIYSLYVMFYPQLVAGPIERPQNLLHQFYENHQFNLHQIMGGLSMMAWGFFQKMVIADRTANYVNSAYGNLQTSSGLQLLIATVLFTVQIYGDFAGYSAIAIGAARVMGFELMTNFNHPYFSKSIAEYWSRWHISLSTWLKDYVYFPLFGSHEVTLSRHYVNLVITFAVSGLWHGANWTFVIWGLYYGVVLVIEGLCGKWWRKGLAWTAARHVVTLSLVLVGSVFFRAPSVTQALDILGRIATSVNLDRSSLQNAVLLTTGDSSALPVFAITWLLIALMFTVEALQEKRLFVFKPLVEHSIAMQATGIILLVQVVILFGSLRASSFIYFQF
jgi:D-alanyl-lipoteichoic acid acyltransferase DltB (MBOAT superfamily)